MNTDSFAQRKIKILHIVRDDKKFFEPVLKQFDSDPRLENRCILVVAKENDAFKSIPKTERITPIWSREQKRDYLTNGDYDVLFLHSFCPSMWYLLNYVPKNKIVIWWAWGMDIYCDKEKNTSMLVPIKLYMPETNKCRLRNYGLTYLAKSLVKKITRPIFLFQKHKTLARIDYFQPVIVDDYYLMKKYNKSFSAGEFYYPTSFAVPSVSDFAEKKSDGMILFGNSASYTNNHLDVWNQIKKYIPASQKIVIPLNYGDMVYAETVSKSVTGDNVEILKDFMDKGSYFKMLDNCSYFVSGILRQQAMGNISYCINHGIKIFLYRDSIVYQYLKRLGVLVYAIEDIDDTSFSSPLSYDEAVQNRIVYGREKERRSLVYEDFVTRTFSMLKIQ